jgi:hypothetical protein
LSFKNLGDELKNIKELKDLFANGETLKSVKKNSPEQYKKLLSYANGKNLDDYLETLNEFGLSNKDKNRKNLGWVLYKRSLYNKRERVAI